MECIAFCTATSYRIKPLFEFMRNRYKTALYRDVVHIEVPIETVNVDILFFSYGASIFWGLNKEKASKFLDEIKEFEFQPREEVETDEFTYIYGDTAKIIEDEITFTDQDILSKIAVSHAIAQSVKLSTFETTIQNTFNSTKHLPEDLAKQGKIPLSRKEIRKKMGELFIERNSVNLHLDVLDTPEFFWEYPEREPLYKMMSNYLDLETRVEVLNHRLDVVHELFEMLGNELNHQHSSRLEWTIICLIVIEVLLTVSRDLLKLT